MRSCISVYEHDWDGFSVGIHGWVGWARQRGMLIRGYDFRYQKIPFLRGSMNCSFLRCLFKITCQEPDEDNVLFSLFLVGDTLMN